jgi:hypothetical protein
MLFKKNKNTNNELTPVEWIIGYLRSINGIQETLSTRMAIKKALKMEQDKFRLHVVISSGCDCEVDMRSDIEIQQNECSYCHKILK